eukprot:SAG11_NODE_1798_length_4246_cov_1.709670_7_plen_54_part_00
MIENDSSEGDKTVFIDNVQVLPIRLGAPILMANAGFVRHLLVLFKHHLNAILE